MLNLAETATQNENETIEIGLINIESESLVEDRGLEPLTSCPDQRSGRSPMRRWIAVADFQPFICFSRFIASARDSYGSVKTSVHGRPDFVDVDLPSLCL